LTLPIAYVPDSTGDGQAFVGVYGGGGQAATIVRDCSGNQLSTASSFGDVSGQVAYVAPLGKHSHTVVGARLGYSRADIWSTDELRDSALAGGTVPPTRLFEYGYFNPYVAWESRYVGLGLGALIGQVPSSLGEEGDKDPVPFSFHVRLGELNTIYLRAGLMENTPLASGGGLLDLGAGYRISEGLHMFTGISVGFYEQTGFLQQARVKLGHRVNLDLSGRAGSVDGIFEYGLSAGLLIRVSGK
jgi:hypothetical protein